MRASLPILVTAALSIAVFFGVFGLRAADFVRARSVIVDTKALEPVEAPQYIAADDTDGNAIPDWQDELLRKGITVATSSEELSATSSDPLATIADSIADMLYGGYVSLKAYDAYTPERGEELAGRVAESIKAPSSHVVHDAHELTVVDDVSEARVLQYRADMRDALAPMVSDAEPEFEMFARYLETHDALWLDRIAGAAARYREAQKLSLEVTVPKDAVPEHLKAVNAVAAYADILEKMAAAKGDNSLAFFALLKSQSDSEEQLLSSFNSLAQYYVRKVTN